MYPWQEDEVTPGNGSLLVGVPYPGSTPTYCLQTSHYDVPLFFEDELDSPICLRKLRMGSEIRSVPNLDLVAAKAADRDFLLPEILQVVLCAMLLNDAVKLGVLRGWMIDILVCGGAPSRSGCGAIEATSYKPVVRRQTATRKRVRGPAMHLPFAVMMMTSHAIRRWSFGVAPVRQSTKAEGVVQPEGYRPVGSVSGAMDIAGRPLDPIIGPSAMQGCEYRVGGRPHQEKFPGALEGGVCPPQPLPEDYRDLARTSTSPWLNKLPGTSLFLRRSKQSFTLWRSIRLLRWGSGGAFEVVPQRSAVVHVRGLAIAQQARPLHRRRANLGAGPRQTNDTEEDSESSDTLAPSSDDE
ncbi:hypothetical protein Cgig2_010948 [Carnegiea gigantea]|uniref:Uncharacterized protein n=1 Tax=Carnegiea gigantea TaxID=171969 RepID=A0A9Q1K0Q6_9CARY|nr:hypothetical protein Cgig2_010948 [Carnegiea gigantea]